MGVPMLFLKTNMTQLRPRLTQLLDQVVHNDEAVIITRHGKEIAAIVNIPDFRRVWDAREDWRDGPKDPITGKRPGAGILRASDAAKGRFWKWWQYER